MLAISSIIRLLITITYLNVSDSSASNICKPLKRLINSIGLFISTRINSGVSYNYIIDLTLQFIVVVLNPERTLI